MRNGSARRVAVSGLLTSLMLVLGLIERQFPLTAAIPGIKLGLANSVLIYALYMLGVKQSIVLMLLKAMMSWLIYTNMQAMFYSLAGGVLSLLAMIALSRIKGVSVIGVSALGAVGFNIGQILMAVAMLHTPQLIVTYLPVLMVSGVATGVLTGVVAQMIAETAGAEVFPLHTVELYPDTYEATIDQGEQERTNGARPELQAVPENLEDYDVIFLGYPNWWGDLPMAVYSFLDEVDLTGKTIVPFVTSGGSGLSGTPDTIAALEPGAEVREGLAVRNTNAADAQESVEVWLTDLGYLG